jgi:hypothetical protein
MQGRRECATCVHAQAIVRQLQCHACAPGQAKQCAERFQRMGHRELLIDIHTAAGRLLPVAQSRVEKVEPILGHRILPVEVI